MNLYLFLIFQWGNLGDGTKTNQPVPVEVLGQNKGEVLKMFAGHYHSGFLTTEGKIFSWGHNGVSFYFLL